MREAVEHIKVPKLRFPEFSGEWEKCSVTNRFKIARGRFSPRPRNNPIYYGGDYPFAQTSDVVNSGGLLSNASQSLNEKGISVSKLFPAKSIFMTIAANIGYVAEIQCPMACPDSLVGIQIDEDDSSRFVLYGLSRIQKKLDFIAPEAAQKNLSLAELSSVKISLPSLPEQQKIAEFLTAVDEKIGKLKRKKELLEAYKKGAMQKLFSQEIRFKDDQGNPYPDWEEKRLGEVYRVTRGKVLATSEVYEHKSKTQPYPVYSSQTKADGLLGYYSQFLFSDAITWTTDGANAGNVSFRTGKFYCTNVCGVLLSNQGYSNSCMAQHINRITHRYVSYVGNPKLMNNVMSEIKTTFPSLPEQQKIAEFLTGIDDKIKAVANQIDKAAEFKKGLLQKMFV